MKLYGLQKMTLLDFPGTVACTVFTGGCNLKCPFCHNALLVTRLNESEPIDEELIISFLNNRVGILDGVCITGGEPLMNPQILDFIEKIKFLGFKVKLDTNGFYPDLLERIIDSNLIDYIAMDIKNSPSLYSMTTGVDNLNIDFALKSVSLIMSHNIDYEFRTTVVKNFHTKDSISEASQLIKGAKRYFLQNFVDSGDLIGSSMTGYSKEELNILLAAAREYVPNAQIRGI